MGKNSAPSYNPPPPPKLPTADELFASGTNYAKQNSPIAFGAREQALQDVNNPNYYAAFQPTSMESALASQNFNNIWPEQEAYLSNILSKSGMAYSPTAAATLGKNRGNLQYQIGQYLTDLGNTRATNSLNMRNIDPMSMVTPYVNTGMQQGNAQAGMEYQYQQALAQAAYQQALQKQQQQQGLFGSLGTLGGAGLGALLAAPTGGMSLGMGAMLGGMGGSAISPIFGGASNPSSMSSLGQMAMMSQMPGMSGMFGGASPVNPVSNMPSGIAYRSAMAMNPSISNYWGGF